jgi:hypothetical protein
VRGRLDGAALRLWDHREMCCVMCVRLSGDGMRRRGAGSYARWVVVVGVDVAAVKKFEPRKGPRRD